MRANEYYFETHWRVEGKIEEIWSILANAEDLPRWWGSVYLRVSIDSSGRVNLLTKGFLPYRLRWSFIVIDADGPHGMKIRASGDLEGSGEWVLVQEGEFAIVTYKWRVIADKPIIRVLSPVLKPIFSWNHRWAMNQGLMSLKRELGGRRALCMESQTANAL